MRKKIGIKDITKEEAVWPGNPACQGCAGSLVGRLVFKALGRNSARVEVASCAPGFMNIRVPSFYAPAFEGAAAFLTGLSRGYKLIGREDIVVAGLIGDGGTVDIGFQGLSAAAERNENIFFFTKMSALLIARRNRANALSPTAAGNGAGIPRIRPTR